MLMSALTETAASTVDSGDVARTVTDAVRKSLAELDRYPVSDLTEDVDLAELIGRLKALTGVLLSIVDN